MAMVQFTSWDRSHHLLQQSKSPDKFHDSRWTWRFLSVWLILIWWIRKKPVKSVQSEIRYRSVELFQRDMFNDNLDIMLTVAFHLPQPTPMWSGYMQMLHHNLPHPGKSSDIFLPMIELTPSDPTCVRSTLEYIVNLASRYNTTPVITFDLQLWWTAYMVIKAKPRESPLRQIILILGGFHTEMSFLGFIGSLMAGTGLKEVMFQVYAEGSVDHMLSGKAVARAVSAHLLVDSSLNTIATAQMLGIPVPRISCEDSITDDHMEGKIFLSSYKHNLAMCFTFCHLEQLLT